MEDVRTPHAHPVFLGVLHVLETSIEFLWIAQTMVGSGATESCDSIFRFPEDSRIVVVLVESTVHASVCSASTVQVQAAVCDQQRSSRSVHGPEEGGWTLQCPGDE